VCEREKNREGRTKGGRESVALGVRWGWVERERKEGRDRCENMWGGIKGKRELGNKG
jgi:hypothetical protein